MSLDVYARQNSSMLSSQFRRGRPLQSAYPASTMSRRPTPNEEHAVTSLSSGETYAYDANGNMR